MGAHQNYLECFIKVRMPGPHSRSVGHRYGYFFLICNFGECFVNQIERKPKVDLNRIISKGTKKGYLVTLTLFDVTKNKTSPDFS